MRYVSHMNVSSGNGKPISEPVKLSVTELKSDRASKNKSLLASLRYDPEYAEQLLKAAAPPPF